MAELANSQVLALETGDQAETSLQRLIVGLLDHRYLLVFRFAALNVAAFAILAAMYLQGWLDPVLANDQTRLITITIGLFIVGLSLCGQRIWQTSAELNALAGSDRNVGGRSAVFLQRAAKLEAPGRANLAASLRLKLSTRITAIKHIANSLVLLGLIGTVLGFIIALSGVDVDQVGDVTAIGPMVTTLINGMSIALYTTLVGSVLNVWLMMNYRLLESGTVHLLTQLIDRAETANARS